MNGILVLNVVKNSPVTIISALLIQKIGLLSTQGLNITSAHTALNQNPALTSGVLSVEPVADMKEESRVAASAQRREYVNIFYLTSYYLRYHIYYPL